MFSADHFASLDSWEDSFKKANAPVLVYGTGNGCEKVMRLLENKCIKISGIFASDGFVRSREFSGFKVMSLAEAENSFPEFSVAAAFGSCLPQVMSNIDDISRRHLLRFPDVAVTGEEVFDRERFLENFARAQKVYRLLADDISRKVMQNVLSFKITGDTQYLRECFTDREETFRSILHFSEDEVYVDAGAYDGDTVTEFVRLTNGRYRRIYAAEPDRHNFRKCLKNTLCYENISLYNAAVWSEDCDVNFTDGSGRQQKIACGKGGKLIRARSVDSILAKNKATYIKYDVEGAESAALEGSRFTINSYCPKICAALYHRAYDIIDIPLQIHSIAGGYSFYMRQYPYYPAWETDLFAVKLK